VWNQIILWLISNPHPSPPTATNPASAISPTPVTQASPAVPSGETATAQQALTTKKIMPNPLAAVVGGQSSSGDQESAPNAVRPHRNHAVMGVNFGVSAGAGDTTTTKSPTTITPASQESALSAKCKNVLIGSEVSELQSVKDGANGSSVESDGSLPSLDAPSDSATTTTTTDLPTDKPTAVKKWWVKRVAARMVVGVRRAICAAGKRFGELVVRRLIDRRRRRHHQNVAQPPPSPPPPAAAALDDQRPPTASSNSNHSSIIDYNDGGLCWDERRSLVDDGVGVGVGVGDTASSSYYDYDYYPDNRHHHYRHRTSLSGTDASASSITGDTASTSTTTDGEDAQASRHFAMLW
jgi:hypothetical protein